MNTSTFADRLAQALDAAGKKRGDLARVLRSPDGTMGISPSGVGQLLSGQSKSATAENCERAARFLGVSGYWLATGEGPMREPLGGALTAAEPAPLYATPVAVLDALAVLAGNLHPSLRLSFADLMHAWLRAGAPAGDEDRRPAMLQLLRAAEPGKRVVAS